MRFARAIFFVCSAGIVGAVYACSSADTGTSIILNQWRVTSLALKDANGHVTRTQAAGYFVLRSDLGYTENVTINGTSHIQLSTYAAIPTPCDAGEASSFSCPVTGIITLTVIGITPVSYNYDINTSEGSGPDGGLGGTMTWVSGALPDGGEEDGGAGATTETWTFTLDSNTVLPQ